MKGHTCIKNLQGMKDEERCQRKNNLNRMKKNCKHRKKATCSKHRSKKADWKMRNEIRFFYEKNLDKKMSLKNRNTLRKC